MIRFGLITFYQCLECCQRGFALLHSIQGSGEIIYGFNVTSTNANGVCKLMFIEMA